jgi:hypothetical protein
MYSPRWLFLFPGMFLFACGLIALVLPLPGRFLIGDVALDVHTMLIGAASMLVGSQAVIFFYLATQYGANERLLPPGPGFANLRGWLNLELTVGIGAVLALCGALGILFMTLSWAFAGFSALDRDIGLRVLIPSITLVGLGIQLVLGGFLSSILDLSTRDSSPLALALADDQEQPHRNQGEPRKVGPRQLFLEDDGGEKRRYRERQRDEDIGL